MIKRRTKRIFHNILVLSFHCCCRSSGTMFISVYMYIIYVHHRALLVNIKFICTRISHRRGALDTTLYDEVCQWSKRFWAYKYSYFNNYIILYKHAVLRQVWLYDIEGLTQYTYIVGNYKFICTRCKTGQKILHNAHFSAYL
jgi:hypothetical protein